MSADQILAGIAESLEQTHTSLKDTQEKFGANPKVLSNIVNQVIEKSGTGIETMSLLSLKSGSLLSYMEHLALVILAHLERIDDPESSEKLKQRAVEATIQHRVTLEKGIKPLEKKLQYQLDKMVRSFHRMEEETAKAEQKIAEQAEANALQDGSNLEDGSESGSDSEDSEDDNLSYKPDAAALAKLAPGNKAVLGKGASKYRPPKISALEPPKAGFDDRAAPKQNNRKLQSMEEYLAEKSDLPQMEASIGSTIVSHGRGGVKTGRDRQRERDIQRYEESNFTRLPGTATKKSFKQKMADRANTFAGEDWSMFNNRRDLKEGTSRKRKAGNAWERAKRSR